MKLSIEILKENREVIIDIITNEVGASRIKDVMNGMVKMIGYNGYADMSIKEIILNVIEVNNIKMEVTLIHLDGVAYDNVSDYNRANNIKMNNIR